MARYHHIITLHVLSFKFGTYIKIFCTYITPWYLYRTLLRNEVPFYCYSLGYVPKHFNRAHWIYAQNAKIIATWKSWLLKWSDAALICDVLRYNIYDRYMILYGMLNTIWHDVMWTNLPDNGTTCIDLNRSPSGNKPGRCGFRVQWRSIFTVIQSTYNCGLQIPNSFNNIWSLFCIIIESSHFRFLYEMCPSENQWICILLTSSY